jgi:hypothetical protein
MPLRKFRYLPERQGPEPVRPRVATRYDGFVASPVHAMHENLWAFADEAPQPVQGLYPGWFRLTFPLSASGALWVLIFWTLGYLR